MRTYFAYCSKQRNLTKQGSLFSCIQHAKVCVLDDPLLVFQVYHARPQAVNASAIMEIDSNGIRELTVRDMKPIKSLV